MLVVHGFMPDRILSSTNLDAHVLPCPSPPSTPSSAVFCFVSEYDVTSGCSLAEIDIGSPVVRMAYAPAAGHVLVAALEVDFSMSMCQVLSAMNGEGYKTMNNTRE